MVRSQREPPTKREEGPDARPMAGQRLRAARTSLGSTLITATCRGREQQQPPSEEAGVWNKLS